MNTASDANNKLSALLEALDQAHKQLTVTGSPYEIQERDCGGQTLRGFVGAPKTLRELIDGGRQFNDQPFTHYLGVDQSFGEFFARVDALAHQLKYHFGLNAGERVAIAMRNRPEWLEAYAAITALPAIVVPLNSWGSAAELDFQLRDSGAKLLICDTQRAALAADIPNLQLLCVDDWSPSQTKTGKSDYEQLISAAMGQAMPALENEIDPESPVQIMYTSGTSGRPKGAVSCHRNICQALMSFEYHAYSSAMANPDSMAHIMGCGFAPCTLLSFPLFHVSGCYSAFLLNLRGGRRVVIGYKWDAKHALEIIENQRVTIFSGSPAMLQDLMQHPDFKQHDTSSLFSLGAGGSACPPALTQTLEQQLPRHYFGTGYGMTESNAICSSCTGAAFHLKPGSAGTLNPLVEFKTCDSDGQPLERGTTGEIWLRSPTNILGYWNNEDATAALFATDLSGNQWMNTGDTGYLDDDNFVYLVGRNKELIIRGGENIYPAEIEAALSQIRGIKETAVFGLPDQRLGEVPVAVIVLEDGVELQPESLKEQLKSRLAAFKIPENIWFSPTPLPRNAAGKLLKSDLKAQYIQ
ncbi:acyl--CoA ligase [Spongiibacter sp. KMU-158]|uniref:Acyl--CoA ligase n=1 Tax=Spongiibacter pelagi TaxID=2760804 RepID=A0A927C0W7_9GAMM|nr:class I adenylate-forming enzyme family protein [Spongiibacter pelagi]MBD2859214.1 acyl--CoA ligase [Spongiibacter pelagi]